MLSLFPEKSWANVRSLAKFVSSTMLAIGIWRSSPMMTMLRMPGRAAV